MCIIGVLLVHNNPDAIGTVLIRPLYNFCTATFFALSGYLTAIPLKDKGFFYRKMQSKHWKLGFLITSAAYIPMYILVVMRNPLKFPWNAICCAVWFTFYYLGLCVRNGRITFKIGTSEKWLAAFAVISILQAAEGSAWYLFGDFDMATTQFKYTALIGTSVSIILFLLYIQNGREMFCGSFSKRLIDSRLMTVLSKGLKQIGDDSFGIYLSHMLMMSVLGKLLYTHVDKIFPLDAALLLLIEMIGIECCKKIFGKWQGFCRWVGLR